MKVYETSDIRNVALIGHGHSGKTTLAAGLFYTTGATNRLMRVDEGNTVTDFDDEEIQRKITISTAVAAAEWNKKKINLLDTPGFNIFINDTKASLVAADAALVLVDGVAGVEVQTEKVWSFCRRVQAAARHRHQQARSRALQLRARPRKRAVMSSAAPPFPIHLPIGVREGLQGRRRSGPHEGATPTRRDGDGKGKEGDIPADLAEAAQRRARSAGRNGGRRQRRAAGRVLRHGHAARRAHSSTACARPSASAASSPCCAPPALHNIGTRPDSELHRRELSRRPPSAARGKAR